MLQRQSKWLSYCTVPTVLEEPTSILGTESRDRRSYRLEQGLSSTGLGFAYQTLDFGKSLLDGIQVG
jgi:hypothetical protein